MIGTLLDTTLSRENPFKEKWEKIVETVSFAYNLSYDEKIELQGSKVAKLIAAIPFIARCKDAATIAEIHLTTYLLTKKTRRIFDYRPTDNVDRFRRLNMMNNFIGGDEKIIEKGMCMLALVMLCEYNRTAEEDFEQDKYNPLVLGSLDFEKERDYLLRRIDSLPCRYLDEIMTTFEAQILWW